MTQKGADCNDDDDVAPVMEKILFWRRLLYKSAAIIHHCRNMALPWTCDSQFFFLNGNPAPLPRACTPRDAWKKKSVALYIFFFFFL